MTIIDPFSCGSRYIRSFLMYFNNSLKLQSISRVAESALTSAPASLYTAL